MRAIGSVPVELANPGLVQGVAKISRPKLRGVGRHEGVIIKSTLAGAVVYDRTPQRGLRRVSVDEFAAGRDCKVTDAVADARVASIMARLRATCSDPSEQSYDPVMRNCEHFASRVLSGKRGSAQLATVVAVVLLALAVLATRG